MGKFRSNSVSNYKLSFSPKLLDQPWDRPSLVFRALSPVTKRPVVQLTTHLHVVSRRINGAVPPLAEHSRRAV